MSDTYRVAFYIRVSREEQAKGYSPEGQKSTLETWIKEIGWKWVKTYQDEVSGKDTRRVRFQEMITDAKNGLFNGICMLDNDRFSRSTKDVLNIMASPGDNFPDSSQLIGIQLAGLPAEKKG